MPATLFRWWTCVGASLIFGIYPYRMLTLSTASASRRRECTATTGFAMWCVLCLLCVHVCTAASNATNSTAAPTSCNVSSGSNRSNSTNSSRAGVNGTTTCNGTNASSTTTPPPTTTSVPTTAVPATTTPAPPQTLSPCGTKKFYCNDSLWRCLRSAPPPEDSTDTARCTCLAQYWQCLTLSGCGTTLLEASECATRATVLVCGDYDVSGKLRVCPAAAFLTYDESGGGWIAALVFFLMALFTFLATLSYVAAARGWVKRPNGEPWFRTGPPIERAVALKLSQRYQEKQPPQQPTTGPTAGDKDDGKGLWEAPDAISLSPESLARYRDYLAGKYRDAREQQRDKGDGSSMSGGDDSNDTDGGKGNGKHRSRRRRDGVDSALVRHTALAGPWPGRPLDPLEPATALPPDAALDHDLATRDVLDARTRMIAQLQRERDLMVREYSVGRASSRDALPSELVVTSEGIQRTPFFNRRANGSDDDDDDDNSPPRRSFAQAGYLADRHGGFGTGSPSPPRNNDLQRAEVPGIPRPPGPLDRTNPISVLFHNLDQLEQQPTIRRRPVESTREMQLSRADEEFPGVPPWAAAARPLDGSPAPHFAWQTSDAPFATPAYRSSDYGESSRPLGSSPAFANPSRPYDLL